MPCLLKQAMMRQHWVCSVCRKGSVGIPLSVRISRNLQRRWIRFTKEVSICSSRFTGSQVLSTLKQNEKGAKVPDLCCEHGMSAQLFYRWCAELGDMDASLMKRFKVLEDENCRMTRMYVEENWFLTSVRKYLKKGMRPSLLKMIAQRAVEHRYLSVRLACIAFRIKERSYWYPQNL